MDKLESVTMPVSDKEIDRLAALERYRVLDTGPEESFDRLTRMACRLLDVPICLVSLVDSNRQWFKSRQGLEAEETSRDISFCTHAILQDDVLIVPDTLEDQRFKDNPLVVDDPKIRFYAGAPLQVGEGHGIGTLCVIDREPREFTDTQAELLVELAHIVVDELELRLANGRLAEELDAKQNALHDFDAVFSHIDHGVMLLGSGLRARLVNDAFCEMWGLSREFAHQRPSFDEIMQHVRDSGGYDIDDVHWPDYARKRRSELVLADGNPILSKQTGGKRLEYTCIALPNGGRMITCTDVTSHQDRERELEYTKSELERIAYYDGLTGLANRAHCQRDLVDKFAFADPSKKFAIIQIDLDDFKRVNDTQGHAAGDHLLQALGERLRMFCDHFENFKTYRWGGDEFIALVERDEDTNLHAMCEELTDLISIPVPFEQVTLRPTVSLGVARYPEDAFDLEALMIFADLALYKTKELGRDGFQFFNSEMKEKIDAEARIEQELRLAIDNGQLQVYYQPQISIEDETITGLETLLRWDHPERGVITPGAFLDVVEEAGLAPAVGRQVFDMAMKAAGDWRDQGVDFGRVALNLSPQHLKHGTAMDDLYEAMQKYGIEPGIVTVELLESFLLDDPDSDTTEMLQQVRRRGINIELDDFGTGYASMSHLSTMPINGIKIDQSFVHPMLENPKQLGIVSSLISMSKLMDLYVVCEGVETWRHVNALADFGSFSIQGYFVSHPLSFDDMTAWIKNGENVGMVQNASKAKLKTSA